MPDPFRVIAHRGASAHAPENTLPAFDLAIEQGATEVELDIRFSADEAIVVFHDDTLDRKTNRTGRVRHHASAHLLETEIGGWFDRMHPEVEDSFEGTSLASLDQVFRRFGSQVHYHIEIKGWDDLLPLRLLQAIDDFSLGERVTVTSFSMRPLVQMRQLQDRIPICFLLRDASDAVRTAEFRPELEGRDVSEVQDYWIDTAARAGFQQVGIRAADVLPRTLARATDRGLDVRGWGVGSDADLEKLVRLGAVGATVDWPGHAIQIVEKEAQSRQS
ncbi:MAG: glycerophosphodiester phosphodiesterase [Myxococcota bacterium]